MLFICFPHYFYFLYYFNKSHKRTTLSSTSLWKISTTPGHSVTLQCRFSDKESKILHWNKETLGHLPEIVAEVVFGRADVIKEFKGSRFSARTDEDLHFFTITNVTKEDEAVYFCQSRATYGQTFINGTFLSVNDGNQLKPVYVRQHPETKWVRPGDSVTMNCSLVSNNNFQCPSEHSVYWFRAGPSGFSPGVIHRHRTDEEETSCVYSLSRTIQDSSDAGTYYCAVVTCGQILFGNGTKVETKQEPDPVVFVLGVLLACCVTVFGAFTLCERSRHGCDHCKGQGNSSHQDGRTGLTSHGSSDLGDAAEAVNYAALSFSTKTAQRTKVKEQLSQQSLYSSVEYRQVDQRMQHQPAYEP
ncbi:uncharacterized protein LOC114864987 [Betta splendens]|uniref:Uncharacterized protein LOC114864987 n=1 Tax=Betta splendens TaxID=158456 RepID=A0A8M1HJL7_BETSP|nr:uncharacterized protein LOC114864987 [Betta splendens]